MSILTLIAIAFLLVGLYALLKISVVVAVVAVLIGLGILAIGRGNLHL